MLVVCQHVMHERRAAAPVPEDEHRLHVYFRIPQQLVVPPVLHPFQRAEYPAYAFREAVFGFVPFLDALPLGYFPESLPIRTDYRIDRQFAKL